MNKGLPAPVGRFQAVALALTQEATPQRSEVERHSAPAKGEPRRPVAAKNGGSVGLQALEKHRTNQGLPAPGQRTSAGVFSVRFQPRTTGTTLRRCDSTGHDTRLNV